MKLPPIEIDKLTIDRKPEFITPSEAVCMNLEGTLLAINRDKNQNIESKECTISVLRHPPHDDFTVTIRPGAVELMEQLIKYSLPFFYTTLPESEALDITYHLNLNDYEHESDWSDMLSIGSVCIPILAIENCSVTPLGPKKLLGSLSEELDMPINHMWLIDKPNALVDFPSKLIAIPEFKGDMSDRHLFDLIERIFIN